MYRGNIVETDSDLGGNYVVLQSNSGDRALSKLTSDLAVEHNQGYSENSIIKSLIVEGGTIGSFDVVDDLNYFSQHAEGYKTTAGLNAHAGGNQSKALGYASFATGNKSEAHGERGFAINYKTQANGHESFAANDLTQANGRGSFATGEKTEANGEFSFTHGSKNKANGNYSRAGGWNSEANGSYSVAEGNGVIAESANQNVQGRFNIADADDKYAYIIGGGSSDTNRKNIHTVDWSGTGWFAKEVRVGGSGQDDPNSQKLITELELTSKLASKADKTDLFPKSITFVVNGDMKVYDVKTGELTDKITGNYDSVNGETVFSGTLSDGTIIPDNHMMSNNKKLLVPIESIEIPAGVYEKYGTYTFTHSGGLKRLTDNEYKIKWIDNTVAGVVETDESYVLNSPVTIDSVILYTELADEDITPSASWNLCGEGLFTPIITCITNVTAKLIGAGEGGTTSAASTVLTLTENVEYTSEAEWNDVTNKYSIIDCNGHSIYFRDRDNGWSATIPSHMTILNGTIDGNGRHSTASSNTLSGTFRNVNIYVSPQFRNALCIDCSADVVHLLGNGSTFINCNLSYRYYEAMAFYNCVFEHCEVIHSYLDEYNAEYAYIYLKNCVARNSKFIGNDVELVGSTELSECATSSLRSCPEMSCYMTNCIIGGAKMDASVDFFIPEGKTLTLTGSTQSEFCSSHRGIQNHGILSLSIETSTNEVGYGTLENLTIIGGKVNFSPDGDYYIHSGVYSCCLKDCELNPHHSLRIEGGTLDNVLIDGSFIDEGTTILSSTLKNCKYTGRSSVYLSSSHITGCTIDKPATIDDNSFVTNNKLAEVTVTDNTNTIMCNIINGQFVAETVKE